MGSMNPGFDNDQSRQRGPVKVLLLLHCYCIQLFSVWSGFPLLLWVSLLFLCLRLDPAFQERGLQTKKIENFQQ